MAESTADRAARFHQAAMNLLPRGVAWARTVGSGLSDSISALVYEFARVEEAADTYRTEMDPTQATALLPEWEAVLGLPDACGAPATTAGRRGAVVSRLTGGGTNSIEALTAAVVAFDAETALHAITHPTQFEVGTDDGGAGQPVGGDEWAHTVTLRITTYADDLDEAGLECVLNGIKRAHGNYLFEYYETQATFQPGQFIAVGPDIVEWSNLSEITPLPSPLTGAITPGTINGNVALDFDGVDSMTTADDWRDYVSAEAKYVIAAIEVDAAGTAEAIFLGALSWGLYVQDTGGGPELIGYSWDGGGGIATPGVPISLATTYVVELLHVDSTMTVRVYDGTVYSQASIAAPASEVDPGELFLGLFNGRVAYFETYGARGRVPLPDVRDSLTLSVAASFIP